MTQPVPPDFNPLPVFPIALISASALAYEVLLMRLFSIIQWHHFAYMIISLALLGYGASGTFLSLLQTWLRPRFTTVFCTNIALFSISTVACYLLAQQIPFNPETVLWDMHQPLQLLAIYLLLSVPFFFAANAIGLVFLNFHTQIAHAYSADLIGAGFGSILVIILLFIVYPLSALSIISLLGSLSLLTAIWQLKPLNRALWTIGTIGIAILAVVLVKNAELELSPYKALSQTLRIEGAKVTSEMFSPLGLLTAAESQKVPIRHAPGLSLMADDEPPEQVAVFTDGGGMTVIDNGNAPASHYHYLDQLTWALPYSLYKPQRVLILGSGGGTDVLQALMHQVPEIHAVELNPQFVTLVQQTYGHFSGHLYTRPGVQLHIAEARGFVSNSEIRYDLIQLPLIDGFGSGSAGLYAIHENYLYTTEALKLFLSRLNPNGYLAISRWINLPPRDTLKLFATAVEALKQMGVPQPGNRLILIRGWQTSTLLIKNGQVSPDKIEAIRAFSTARAFDICWFPGIQAHETNRYNILDKPYFYNAASALLGPENQTFLEQYKFNLTPASDDKPYFHRFFLWRSLPEIIDLRGRGGTPLLEWGYIVLVATLIQAIIASIILILLPLTALRPKDWDTPPLKATYPTQRTLNKHHVLIYFFTIGLAFFFIEIAFIQRFILFLHHPLYATAVVLTSFLIFAGLGSAISRRLAQANLHQQGLWTAVTGIFCVSVLYLLILGPIFELLIGWPVITKIAVTILLIMPLAICMGIPFPLAMDSLGDNAPKLIPWAWGVNGCASVISAVLATLLAIHFGFSVVVLSAIALYLVAAITFSRHDVLFDCK